MFSRNTRLVLVVFLSLLLMAAVPRGASAYSGVHYATYHAALAAVVPLSTHLKAIPSSATMTDAIDIGECGSLPVEGSDADIAADLETGEGVNDADCTQRLVPPIASFTLKLIHVLPRSEYQITTNFEDGGACFNADIYSPLLVIDDVGDNGQGADSITVKTDVHGNAFATIVLEDCLPQRYDIHATLEDVGAGVETHFTVRS